MTYKLIESAHSHVTTLITLRPAELLIDIASLQVWKPSRERFKGSQQHRAVFYLTFGENPKDVPLHLTLPLPRTSRPALPVHRRVRKPSARWTKLSRSRMRVALWGYLARRFPFSRLEALQARLPVRGIF